MNIATRLGIITTCFGLCAGALVLAKSPRERYIEADHKLASLNAVDFSNVYQQVTTEGEPNFDFAQVESIIRHHYTAISHRGRIEFGLVKVLGGTAEVEVLFFARDGRIRPVIYQLVARNNSWKIANVQRMWFVPRSHLLRGLRA
jgi:Domain of unknown function (DUF4864)